MTKMKSEDLKTKTPDELHKMLLDARKDQLNFRFQKSGGQLTNTAQMLQKRRDIARIKTQLSVKRLAETGGKKPAPAAKADKTKAPAKTKAKKTAKAKKAA